MDRGVGASSSETTGGTSIDYMGGTVNVEQLLAKKGDRVVTNRPEDTIEAAAQLLNVLRDYLIAKG